MTKDQLHTLLEFIEHNNDCVLLASRGEQDTQAYKYSNEMRNLLQIELLKSVAATNWDGK
jgi:hypothetical protein